MKEDKYSWVWSEKNQSWDLKNSKGDSCATVWPNGTWFTWDENGCGGENDVAKDRFSNFLDLHHQAKREAWAACERQCFFK